MPPTARITYLPTTVYVGTTVTFTNGSSPGTDSDGLAVPITSATWTLPDGSSSTSSAPTYTFPTAGSFTASLALSDANGGTDSATVTISVTDAVTSGEGKWIKILTPDYSTDEGEQQSYLRLGAIPTNADADLEIDGNKVSGTDRHGWYSYTTGNRLEATNGDREVWIGGGNRFSIGGGGLGAFDAEPIYGLHFRQESLLGQSNRWRKTEWGRVAGDTYQFGDTESYFLGFTLSSFVGLQASLFAGATISASAAINFGASVAANFTASLGVSLELTKGWSIQAAKTIDQKARDRVTIKTKKKKSGGVEKGESAAKVTTAVIGGLTALVGTVGFGMAMGQAGTYDEAGQDDASDSTETSGFAPAANALTGVALAGVLAMGIVAMTQAHMSTKRKGEFDAKLEIDGEKIVLGNQEGGIGINKAGYVSILMRGYKESYIDFDPSGKASFKNTNVDVNNVFTVKI